MGAKHVRPGSHQQPRWEGTSLRDFLVLEEQAELFRLYPVLAGEAVHGRLVA
jgi:hypothetical protein